MTIEKRVTKSGIKYRVKIRLKGYRSRSETFDSYQQAKTYEAEMKAAMISERLPPSLRDDQRSVPELIHTYIRIVVPQKALSNRKTILQRLGFFLQVCAALRCKDLTRSLAMEIREMLRQKTHPYTGQPISNSTVNRYMDLFSAVCTFAVKDLEWMDENPVQKLRKLKEPKGKVRFLDDRERQALLEECQQSRCKMLFDFVNVALWTGGRKSELLYLKPCSFQKHRRVLEFRHDPGNGQWTKTSETRSVPLNDSAYDSMVRLCHGRSENEYLFPSSRNPSKFFNFQKPFERCCERAGVKNFTIHSLRHTFGSYLSMGGANAFTIMALMGHKSITTSQIYVHVHNRFAREAVANMGEVLGKLG